jgi:hypothetical protein
MSTPRIPSSLGQSVLWCEVLQAYPRVSYAIVINKSVNIKGDNETKHAYQLLRFSNS